MRTSALLALLFLAGCLERTPTAIDPCTVGDEAQRRQDVGLHRSLQLAVVLDGSTIEPPQIEAWLALFVALEDRLLEGTLSPEEGWSFVPFVQIHYAIASADGLVVDLTRDAGSEDDELRAVLHGALSRRTPGDLAVSLTNARHERMPDSAPSWIVVTSRDAPRIAPDEVDVVGSWLETSALEDALRSHLVALTSSRCPSCLDRVRDRLPDGTLDCTLYELSPREAPELCAQLPGRTVVGERLAEDGASLTLCMLDQLDRDEARANDRPGWYVDDFSELHTAVCGASLRIAFTRPTSPARVERRLECASRWCAGR